MHSGFHPVLRSGRSSASKLSVGHSYPAGIDQGVAAGVREPGALAPSLRYSPSTRASSTQRSIPAKYSHMCVCVDAHQGDTFM